MSMPSSRLLVATRAGSRPSLSASSISRRCSRAMLPWWARTSSSPARSFRRWASRSARRRLFVKTIVLRWARMSSRIRGWIAGQMLVRRSSRQAGAPGPPGPSVGAAGPRRAGSCPRPGRRPAGRAPCACRCPRPRPRGPARSRRGTGRSSRGAAASPTARSAGAAAPTAGRRRSRRSSESARWAPRFVPATAWTSSTMTVSTPRRVSRAPDVSRRYRLSGRRDEDVGRGLRQPAARLLGRVARSRRDRDAGRVRAQALRRERDPVERRPEVALDVVGERLERRDVEDPDGPRVPSGRRRRRVPRQPVQAPQERGERLAGAGRGVDERVAALGDGRPAAGLGRRRRRERALEPRAHRRGERRERVGCRHGLGC